MRLAVLRALRDEILGQEGEGAPLPPSHPGTEPDGRSQPEPLHNWSEEEPGAGRGKPPEPIPSGAGKTQQRELDWGCFPRAPAPAHPQGWEEKSV